LTAVLDQFAGAAGGLVDQEFWRSFIKVNGESGRPSRISGWINALFPYIQTKKGLHFNRYVRDWERGRDQREPEGPCDFEFGHGLSRAPFNWQFLGREIPMESLGGFVGVSQDAQTTALRPAIGWALREAAG